jgi:dienelactone hydrolase
MKQLADRILVPVAIALILLTACVAPPPSQPAAPTAQPLKTAAPGDLPPAVEYNLGDATIIQERFPEESRFRNMPVRLNGIIAAPEGGGPHPVVVIFHGSHHGCPLVEERGLDVWPCDPAVEQPNYRGFAYLVRELAAQGYVALSLNINAENTLGFGEPVAGERLQQLVDRHLQALAAASSGGPNDFGVELKGRADLSRLALFGHSRGGEAAMALANSPEMLTAGRGYGPVAGVLLIASAAGEGDPWSGSHVPLAAILPACDGDIVTQDGQFFYEGARLSPQQTQWATSAWLERANHNYFNSILADDAMGRRGRPDCEPILAAEVQRDWLADCAGDFLAQLFGRNAAPAAEAATRLGMDATAPAAAEELTTNLLGGAVTTRGIVTHFCPKDFYSAWSLPGSEPCRRNTVTIPGQPSHAVISWEQPGTALRFALPDGAGDLSGYSTLSLRASVDPASPLNAAGSPQAFSVQLTDRAGNRAAVQTRPNEPALGFPPGLMQYDPTMETGFFTGLVPLTTIRLPISGFRGVDLAAIREVALEFDQTPSGTLFLGDIEWVR